MPGLATAEKAKVELEGLQAMERILHGSEEEEYGKGLRRVTVHASIKERTCLKKIHYSL